MSKVSKKIQETRKKLIELSRIARTLKNEKDLDMTINEILLKFMYNADEDTEFNSFMEWKRKGYTILKGAKAFVIWGQPTKVKAKEEKTKEEQDEDGYEFFPLCYLFSDKQVYKVDAEQQQKEEVKQQSEPEFLNL